jgi:hypothetical protein
VQLLSALETAVGSPGRSLRLSLGLIFLALLQECNQCFLYSRYTDFSKRKVQFIAGIVQGFDAASP